MMKSSELAAVTGCLHPSRGDCNPPILGHADRAFLMASIQEPAQATLKFDFIVMCSYVHVTETTETSSHRSLRQMAGASRAGQPCRAGAGIA